jgi:hypothetical protein
VDSRQRTLDRNGFAQFLQRHIRVVAHQASKPLLMFERNLGLSAGEAMPRSNIPRALSLLQQLLDQPQRDVVPLRDLSPRPVASVTRRHNPFPQVHRYRSHALLIAHRPRKGYSFN